MSEKTNDVFISYSTKDAQTAFRLLEILEQHGLRCWIAPRNIPQGAQWAEEIDAAIQRARVFVVIISGNSVQSKQVPKEVALAVTACEGIFPFRIDETNLQGSFRYYLSDYQFTDAIEDQQQKMTELAEVICNSLGIRKPEAVSDAAPREASVKQKTAGEKADRSVPEKAASAAQPPVKSRKGLWIGLAAAAAAVIIICLLLFRGGGTGSGDAAADAGAVSVQETAETQSAAVSSSSALTETQSSETPGTEAQSSAAEPEAGNEQTEAESKQTKAESEQMKTADSSTAGERVSAASNLLTGGWKLIGYEDRGRETDYPLSDLYLCADGTVYPDKDTGLKKVGTETAEQLKLTGEGQLDFSGIADWSRAEAVETAAYEITDTYDGSISMKTSAGFALTPISIEPLSYTSGEKTLPEENPTGLTFAQCYPDSYLTLHFAGTVQESPVKTTEEDTWMVYQRRYPLLGTDMEPTLIGDWTDESGNRYHFYAKDDALAFELTDANGTV